MSRDFINEMTTNPLFQDAYQRGSNSSLLTLLKEPVLNQTVPAIKTRSEIINLLSPYLSELSLSEQGALELMIGTALSPGELDFNAIKVVNAIKALWNGKISALNVTSDLDAIKDRQAFYYDILDIFPTLQSIREKLKEDVGSYYNRYYRNEI